LAKIRTFKWYRKALTLRNIDALKPLAGDNIL
jgi:hypothetical protein